MPRSFQEIIEQGIQRALFVQHQEAKAPKRRPRRTRQQPGRGTLFAIRNSRLAIREAALRRVQIVITYRKETTSEVKKYIVAPYSYRYRRLKTGFRKLLFAFDMKDKHIKGFVVRNLRNVALTDRKFVPRWSVEIG
jgi:hypothetical protein